jgi:L-asparaginase
MTPTAHGLAPGADLHRWLEGITANIDARVTASDLAPLIDSSMATPASWQAIVDALRAGRANADAFVVLHGTDTMAFSAAAASFALTDFDAPVIFTGSQLPLGAAGSDAAANVAHALEAAAQQPAGVSLCFGGRLLRGNRATKASSWAFDGFTSPTAAPLARVGAPWQWGSRPPAGCGWSDPAPYRRCDIAVITMTPGITAARVRAALAPTPEAVIVRAYGAGNVPANEPGLVDAFAQAIETGTPVIVTSQCPQAAIEVGRYAASDALGRAGAVGAGDMTFEATYAKTAFLLSQGLRGADLAAWIPCSIAGEIGA